MRLIVCKSVPAGRDLFAGCRIPIAILVLAFSLVANPQRLNGDLILHYQANGNVLDSSGNGHDGTLFNGATFGTGVHGQAFSFDGVNDFVAGPVVPQIDLTSFSVALWINAVPENHLRLLIDSSHGGTRGGSLNYEGFAVQLFANGRVDLAIGNGAGNFPHVVSDTHVADNTFHHVAATFDGTIMSMYVDGVLEETTVFTGTPATSGRPIRLGNHDQFTNRALNGLLDDVRIYNHVLAASEVSALASVPEPGSFSCVCGALAAIAMKRRRHRSR